MAWCTDVSDMPATAVEQLGGLDTLFLDMLRERSHKTHLNLAEATARGEELTTEKEQLLQEMERVKEEAGVNAQEADAGAEIVEAAAPDQKRVYRANHRADQKPMTIEEALLAIEDGRDYLVYRDSETDRLSVLLRRRDGHFDLVEA